MTNLDRRTLLAGSAAALALPAAARAAVAPAAAALADVAVLLVRRQQQPGQIGRQHGLDGEDLGAAPVQPSLKLLRFAH